MHIYNTCIYNCRNEIIQGWLSSQTQPFWKLIFLKVHNANVAVMATRLKSFLITFYLVSTSLRYCKRITFSYVFYFGFGRKAASAKSRTLLNALHTCKRIGTLFKFFKFKSTLVKKFPPIMYMLNIIRWQKNCENLIQGYLKNTVESPKINLMFGTQHKYIYAWKKFYKNLSLIPSKYGYEIKF